MAVKETGGVSANLTLVQYFIDKSGLTQKDLSSKCSISLEHLRDCLRGKYPMTQRTIESLAEVLDIAPETLMMPGKEYRRNRNEAALYKFLEDPKKKPTGLQWRDVITLQDKLGDFTLDHNKAALIDNPGFWVDDKYQPFKSDNVDKVRSSDKSTIIVRGRARVGKSCMLIGDAITNMFKYPGMRVLITRAFNVDLSVVRATINDMCRWKFSDPACVIGIYGGPTQYTNLYINEGELVLLGIDTRPDSVMGDNFDIIIHSQAEQLQRETYDKLLTRATPLGGQFLDADGNPISKIYLDANPHRTDHWIERLCDDEKVLTVNFGWEDNPAYYDADGNPTKALLDVQERLSSVETEHVRKRLFEGIAANPEGVIITLTDKDFITELPEGFPAGYRCYRAIDFGYKDPTVCLWIAEHNHTGNIIIYREWRHTEVDTVDMGKDVIKHTKDERILDTITDTDPNLQKILRDKCKMKTTMVEKGQNSINAGLDLIHDRLNNNGVQIFENLVKRDPRIVAKGDPMSLRDECDRYGYDIKGNKDIPIDKYNHAIDAWRYWELWRANKPATAGVGITTTKEQLVL